MLLLLVSTAALHACGRLRFYYAQVSSGQVQSGCFEIDQKVLTPRDDVIAKKNDPFDKVEQISLTTRESEASAREKNKKI